MLYNLKYRIIKAADHSCSEFPTVSRVYGHLKNFYIQIISSGADSNQSAGPSSHEPVHPPPKKKRHCAPKCFRHLSIFFRYYAFVTIALIFDNSFIPQFTNIWFIFNMFDLLYQMFFRTTRDILTWYRIFLKPKHFLSP